MKDYIKVLLSDIKQNIKSYENQIETLEIKIETSKIFVEKLEKALKQPTDKSDIAEKIKDFINELEHNIQADKDNGETLISGVSCDYVIERLKDIINKLIDVTKRSKNYGK